MTFIIRRAVSSDAKALADLATRIFVDTFAADNRPEDMELFIAQAYGEEKQRREIDDPDLITLVADSGAGLLAYAQLRRANVPDGAASDATVQIARFYVDRSWHGRGVAQELMRHCDEIARGFDARAVWLGVWERNDRAIAFYKKCGFAEIGKMDFHVGSDRQTDVVMVRGLSTS